MMKLILVATFCTLVLAKPQIKIPNYQKPISSTTTEVAIPANIFQSPKNYVPNEFEKVQNQNARYDFSSNVEDHISDLTQTRRETRDGLNVKGSYSYSDGYYKRTVHYEADENGYRVIGQEAVPLQGPQIDLMGTASVDNAAHGTHTAYRIQSVPIPGPVAKIIN